MLITLLYQGIADLGLPIWECELLIADCETALCLYTLSLSSSLVTIGKHCIPYYTLAQWS